MRARRNHDWVPCSGYGLQQALSDPTDAFGVPQSIILVQQRLPQEQQTAGFLPTGSTGATPQFDEQMTVIRIVGEVWHYFVVAPGILEITETKPFLLVERIHVALLDLDSDDIFVIVPDSLVTPQDAEERFLWSRTYGFAVSQPPFTPGRVNEDFIPVRFHPFQYHIDVRVKRRLAPGECLVYSWQWVETSLNDPRPDAFDSIAVFPYLRTYVRR